MAGKEDFSGLIPKSIQKAMGQTVAVSFDFLSLLSVFHILLEKETLKVYLEAGNLSSSREHGGGAWLIKEKEAPVATGLRHKWPTCQKERGGQGELG